MMRETKPARKHRILDKTPKPLPGTTSSHSLPFHRRTDKRSPSLCLFRAGLANVFCEGPDNNHLRLCDPYHACPDYTTRPKHVCVSVLHHGCVPIKRLTDTEIWISYDFPVSGNSLLLIFFQPFKNNKNHSLLTGHTKTGGQPALARGPQFAIPGLGNECVKAGRTGQKGSRLHQALKSRQPNTIT